MGPNPRAVVVWAGYSVLRTLPIIRAPYVRMNQGSICARFATSVSMRLNAKRKRTAVTRMEYEVLLKRELKKKANPSTATR